MVLPPVPVIARSRSSPATGFAYQVGTGVGAAAEGSNSAGTSGNETWIGTTSRKSLLSPHTPGRAGGGGGGGDEDGRLGGISREPSKKDMRLQWNTLAAEAVEEEVARSPETQLRQLFLGMSHLPDDVLQHTMAFL